LSFDEQAGLPKIFLETQSLTLQLLFLLLVNLNRVFVPAPDSRKNEWHGVVGEIFRREGVYAS
jgi:hypothetical protein